MLGSNLRTWLIEILGPKKDAFILSTCLPGGSSQLVSSKASRISVCMLSSDGLDQVHQHPAVSSGCSIIQVSEDATVLSHEL